VRNPPETADVVERVLSHARRLGAAAADAMLVETDGVEARVRDREIDFVSQARGRTLGIRAFVGDTQGLRSALTSTSDLAPAAVTRMAEEAVALARATAADPAAGLPEGGFASSLPDLELLDPADRSLGVEERIECARRAEAAARSLDPRITNSEGSQVSAHFQRVVYGNSAGFFGEFESASHALFCEPIARENGAMQRDY